MADFTWRGSKLNPRFGRKTLKVPTFVGFFWGWRCSFLCFGMCFSMKSMEIPHGSWFLYHFGKTSSAVFPHVFFVFSKGCFPATRSTTCLFSQPSVLCVELQHHWGFNKQNSFSKKSPRKSPQVSAPHHHVPPEVFFRDGTAVLETSSCQPENTWEYLEITLPFEAKMTPIVAQKSMVFNLWLSGPFPAGSNRQRGYPLQNATFWGPRSCEVAIVWPDQWNHH